MSDMSTDGVLLVVVVALIIWPIAALTRPYRQRRYRDKILARSDSRGAAASTLRLSVRVEDPSAQEAAMYAFAPRTCPGGSLAFHGLPRCRDCGYEANGEDRTTPRTAADSAMWRSMYVDPYTPETCWRRHSGHSGLTGACEWCGYANPDLPSPEVNATEG